MKDKEIINTMYEEIADELNISDSLFEKVCKSYKALGNYLENELSGRKVEIFPQGSMNLGTLIKPISEDDDYDLDAVCKIYDDINDPKELKNLIGDVLKESDRYSKMLQPEGKRCWTIKYNEESHFHMDILPCCPYKKNDSSLKITHKENGLYGFKISNPEGYAVWFNNIQENERKKIYTSKSVEYSNNVEDLRKYDIRTNLQKTIQILKRHRDIKYFNTTDIERDNKPISIIITTIAAKLYSENDTIVDLIDKFTSQWKTCFEIDSSNNYILKNPVNESENFADKWIMYPDKKKAFFDWIDDLRKDLITNNYLLFDGLIEKSKYLKRIFGDKVINDVFEKKSQVNSKLYVDSKKVATLTTNKTNIEVRKHNFYGN